MTWLPVAASVGNDLTSIFALVPGAYDALADAHEQVWTLVDPVVLELCRLRMADILFCNADLALRYEQAINAGLTEDKISILPDWQNSPGLAPKERACLAVAEQFVNVARTVTDEQIQALRVHMEDSEVFYFMYALSIFEATQRLTAVFDVAAPPEILRVSRFGQWRSPVLLDSSS